MAKKQSKILATIHATAKGLRAAGAVTRVAMREFDTLCGPPVASLRPTHIKVRIKDTHMARTAIHPGEHLAEQLAELNMSAAELACLIKVPTNRITRVINGERAVTGDTALRLVHFFGGSAEFWLNLQKMYELRLAEQEFGAAIKALPRLSSGRTKRQSPQSRAA